MQFLQISQEGSGLNNQELKLKQEEKDTAQLRLQREIKMQSSERDPKTQEPEVPPSKTD